MGVVVRVMNAGAGGITKIPYIAKIRRVKLYSGVYNDYISEDCFSTKAERKRRKMRLLFLLFG